jgi:hypothetical protein
MKCDRAKTNILLSTSRELDVAGRKAMEDHLAVCKACREYRVFLQGLFQTAGPAVGSLGPSAATLAKIAARGTEAQKDSGDRAPWRRFGPTGPWWLAAAAALVIVGSVWQLSGPRPMREDASTVVSGVSISVGAGIADMNALISVAGGDGTDDEVSEGLSDAAVDDLARQLLIYQGFEDADAWGGTEATESDV